VDPAASFGSLLPRERQKRNRNLLREILAGSSNTKTLQKFVARVNGGKLQIAALDEMAANQESAHRVQVTLGAAHQPFRNEQIRNPAQPGHGDVALPEGPVQGE